MGKAKESKEQRICPLSLLSVFGSSSKTRDVKSVPDVLKLHTNEDQPFGGLSVTNNKNHPSQCPLTSFILELSSAVYSSAVPKSNYKVLNLSVSISIS